MLSLSLCLRTPASSESLPGLHPEGPWRCSPSSVFSSAHVFLPADFPHPCSFPSFCISQSLYSVPDIFNFWIFDLENPWHFGKGRGKTFPALLLLFLACVDQFLEKKKWCCLYTQRQEIGFRSFHYDMSQEAEMWVWESERTNGGCVVTGSQWGPALLSTLCRTVRRTLEFSHRFMLATGIVVSSPLVDCPSPYTCSQSTQACGPSCSWWEPFKKPADDLQGRPRTIMWYWHHY